MKRFLAYVTMAAVLLIFSAGCRRIPLYDRSTRVDIIIDLDRELDHDIVMSVDKPLEKIYTDKIEGVVPNYYEVLVYDTVTDELVSSNIVGEKGGSLSIFPGSYHLVIYSFGTESTQMKDLHNRTKANAFTTDITSSKGEIIKSKINESAREYVSKGYEDDPIINEPDHLYTSNEMDVTIDAFIGGEQTVTIRTTVSTILDVYSLEVLNIKGAENIEKVEAFVTGQILSNYFGRPERDSSPATVYVDMSVDVENSRLYTVFNTFGKLPGEQNQIFLDITVTDSGGGQYRYIYDVTDQFDDPGNEDHQLVIDGELIDIPKAEHGGGGFRPEIDEWEREDIDVPLG